MAYSQNTINKTLARNEAALESLEANTAAKVRQLVRLAWDRYGILLLLYSGYRSPEEQADLYAKYLAGGALAAPPLLSFHNYGLAVDLVPLKESGAADWNSKNWDKIGALGKEVGLNWGKSFGDKPHFENRDFGTVAQLKAQGGIKYAKEQTTELIKVAQRNPIKTGLIIVGISLTAYVLYKSIYGRDRNV